MNDQIKAMLDKHKLTVESVFIPFSQSRNAGEKSPSLNWRVTLKQNGRAILSTEYSAGCGHAPAYKQSSRRSYDNNRLIAWECENGKPGRHLYSLDVIASASKEPIKPDSADVIYSLLIDSEVIDYSSFEEWAGNFGYDQDSRNAEQTYKTCTKIALQFRRIGESTIAELREAFQDY